MDSDTQFDTVVAGSGMGGMTAAAMLTHAGYKVLVLEAAHALGGCSSSFYRKGYWFESGATTLIGFDRHQLLKRLEEVTGIRIPRIELDLESPPPPPQDALHAYFVNGSLDLLHDLRNAETAVANWQLALQPSLSDSLTFSWDINSIVLNGTLTFSIPDISEEIDMTAVSEIKIHRDETNNLSVEYVLGL